MFNIKCIISLAAAVFPVTLLHSVKNIYSAEILCSSKRVFYFDFPPYSFMALTGSEDP